MGRLFFYTALSVTGILILLFFPIVIETDAHFDLNKKKFAFSVYFYRLFKILGGYAATYPGGIALHVSPKKAILIPYAEMDSERKRFSFVRNFRLICFRLTTETGAEYLLPISLAHAVLRIWFFAIGGKKRKIENNLWLTDGDVLRVSASFSIYFNIYILLVNFIKFLKEKMKILWRRKKKKSTI